MKRWSEADTIRFVKLYCDSDCLWDTTKPTYKNNQLRVEALQHIVTEMNLKDFTLSDARTKVKSLRNTYSQELKKMKYDGYYTPALKWFEIMDSKLKKIKMAEETAISINNLGAYSIDSEQEIFAYGADDEVYEDDGVMEENPLELPSTTTTTTTLPFSGMEEAWNGTGSSGPKRPRQEFGGIPEQYRSRPPTLAEEDEFDAFGKYMAQGLKNMPIHLALQCQNDLQATLTRFRFMSLGAPPTSIGTSSAGRNNHGSAQVSSDPQQGIVSQPPSIKSENFDEVCIENLGCNQ